VNWDEVSVASSSSCLNIHLERLKEPTEALVTTSVGSDTGIRFLAKASQAHARWMTKAVF
jgi:hypothetical protein